MNSLSKTNELVKIICQISKKEGLKTGFTIGNTSKKNNNSLYFTPVRNTGVMVFAGVIVYSEKQAIDIAKAIDGKVDYILVDAEKKIPAKLSILGDSANIERAVREAIRKSTLWVYKGNDIAVDAVDALLTQLLKKSIRGLGGAKVAILGAGNLGTKLALKLVERGANVTITRQDEYKLNSIVEALNFIKPVNTLSSVYGEINNKVASKNADIIIGTTHGKEVITRDIVKCLADGAVIVDVGKGTLYPDAISEADKNNIDIYRLDVTAAFIGTIHRLLETEKMVENKLGRRELYNEKLVSGGLLGCLNEVVVDNIWNPTQIFGIADGEGDFIRELSKEDIKRLNILKNKFENS